MKSTAVADKRGQASVPAPATKPLHPYIVLLVAILLPGMGQVLNHTPGRGLLMVFFILLLGMITFHLTTPDQSFIGRYAGGLFIYAIAIMDAYQWARYRYEWHRKQEVPR